MFVPTGCFVCTKYRQIRTPHSFSNTPWKLNIAPENIPSQKETSIPTIIFQGRAVKLPGCMHNFISMCSLVVECFIIHCSENRWRWPTTPKGGHDNPRLMGVASSSCFSQLKFQRKARCHLKASLWMAELAKALLNSLVQWIDRFLVQTPSGPQKVEKKKTYNKNTNHVMLYISKVASTHLWNTPLNLSQQAVKGILS